ncbi:MAG: hypothetical protein ACYTF0_05550, partial [Planctomycetota bacterium]
MALADYRRVGEAVPAARIARERALYLAFGDRDQFDRLRADPQYADAMTPRLALGAAERDRDWWAYLAQLPLLHGEALERPLAMTLALLGALVWLVVLVHLSLGSATGRRVLWLGVPALFLGVASTWLT